MRGDLRGGREWDGVRGGLIGVARRCIAPEEAAVIGSASTKSAVWVQHPHDRHDHKKRYNNRRGRGAHEATRNTSVASDMLLASKKARHCAKEDQEEDLRYIR